MSEVQMYWSALVFDLAVPLSAIAVMLRVPRLRDRAVVVLGAISPLLVFYASVAVAYFLHPKQNVFAFYAMGGMTFFAYLVLLVMGFALAFIPKPANLYARFVMGFASVPLTYLIFLVASLTEGRA